MATPIDIGLLGSFSAIFIFIFVFAISYAVLGMTGVLGKDNKNIVGIVAFCIAIFLTISLKPRLIIMDMIPWFALVIVFFMFLMLAMRYVFGTDKGDSVLKAVMGSSDTGAGWWVFIIMVSILLVALSSSVGPEVTPGSNTTTSGTATTDSGSATTGGSTETGNWQSNVLNTLYHPKMLGAIIILAIALAAIQLLSRVSPVK
jgi:hypothetical protein